MPRASSYSGSFDEMPLSVQRAAQVDRSFYSEALCRNNNDQPVHPNPWTADPKQVYRVAGQRIKGAVLNELALETCAICPVQWECADAAIRAIEAAGVWAATLEELRILAATPDALENARKAKIPVRAAVRALAGGIS